MLSFVSENGESSLFGQKENQRDNWEETSCSGLVLKVGVIRVCRTAEFGENVSRNHGILNLYQTRIFSKMISGIFMRNAECGIFMEFYGFSDPSSVSCKKRSLSHLRLSGQHYEKIFKALHKNFNFHTLPLFPTGWMKMSKKNTNLCNPILITKSGMRNFGQKRLERGISTENRAELRISIPLMTPT